VRALVLAALLATSFASVAEAENDNQSIRTGGDAVMQVGPVQSPVPTAEPAPPVAVQPVVQPAPQPAPAPVVVAAKPWPENVPSLKPGTDKSVAKTTKAATTVAAASAGTGASATASKTASATATGTAASATQTQVASLPPAPDNAASLTPIRVVLQAAVIPGAPPLNENLVWTVNKPGTSNKRIGDQVATVTGPRGEFMIPAGDYVVTVKQREAIVSQPLTVGAIPVVKTLALNTSIVSVRVIPYTGGKVVTEPVHWEVFATALGRPSKDSMVGEANAPETSFTLAAGYYVVRSHYHGVKSDLAMLVEPGVKYAYTVDLYAANLVAQVVGPTGKPVPDAKWQIVRAGADADGSHEVIATDTGANPTFLVREGNYTVIATGSDGSVGQAPIAIIAGKTQKVKVVLKPGTATAVKTSG
jgi:hypothetical protein